MKKKLFYFSLFWKIIWKQIEKFKEKSILMKNPTTWKVIFSTKKNKETWKHIKKFWFS